MPTVFVSYRRSDLHPDVQRLVDALVAAHGPHQIVTRITGLRGAQGYRQEVEATIARSAGVIVVLGPDFMGVDDALGRGLLDDREDPLRIEIATALKIRPNTTYFALVGGLEMPQPSQLPAPLRPMTRRGWVMLEGGRPFEEGVSQFVTIAGGLLRGAVQRAQRLIVLGVVVLLILSVGFALLLNQLSGAGNPFQ